MDEEQEDDSEEEKYREKRKPDIKNLLCKFDLSPMPVVSIKYIYM